MRLLPGILPGANGPQNLLDLPVFDVDRGLAVEDVHLNRELALVGIHHCNLARPALERAVGNLHRVLHGEIDLRSGRFRTRRGLVGEDRVDLSLLERHRALAVAQEPDHARRSVDELPRPLEYGLAAVLVQALRLVVEGQLGQDVPREILLRDGTLLAVLLLGHALGRYHAPADVVLHALKPHPRLDRALGLLLLARQRVQHKPLLFHLGTPDNQLPPGTVVDWVAVPGMTSLRPPSIR